MGVLDLFRPDGQVALVTGCSRGIGEAMAVALAEAGSLNACEQMEIRKQMRCLRLLCPLLRLHILVLSA